MRNFRNIKISKTVAFCGLAIALMSSCTKSEDSAGYEYTPDMYRSPAIETYVDYGMIKDRMVDSLTKVRSARLPVEGTIPFHSDPSSAAIAMPYALKDPIKDYDAADSLVSPIQVSQENIDEGKRIYSFMCVHCHGEEGKGNGAVVEKAGHAAPGAYDGALKDLSVGKMFHTLTHGKGMMGSHASQLTKKERWQVIQYVQVLQHGGTHPAMEEAVSDTVQTEEVVMPVEPTGGEAVNEEGH